MSEYYSWHRLEKPRKREEVNLSIYDKASWDPLDEDNVIELFLPPGSPLVEEIDCWKHPEQTTQRGGRYYELAYTSLLHHAIMMGFSVFPASRKPASKFFFINLLWLWGVQFFLPVWAGTKISAWKRPAFKPIFLETLKSILFEENSESTSKRTRRKYRFDIAIRLGVWRMPQRIRDYVLICLDIDDWLKIPSWIVEVLVKARNVTFVVQTQRGLHLYFWVPRVFAKSHSLPGIADWLGTGKYAVLTGPDRLVLNAHPIATLSKEDAEALYKFIKTKPIPQYDTWSLDHAPAEAVKSKPGAKQYTLQSIAYEGERNTFINTMLYKYRYRYSDAELEELALRLARENCVPPYTDKEARYVLKSVIRHRKPSQTKPDFIPRIKANDHRIIRLGKFYPTQGLRFTAKEYQEKLLANGWTLGKRGRVEAAFQDIAFNLERGLIRQVDKIKSGSKGGRPTLVYERVSDYDEPTDYILPCKITPKNLRLSLFLRVLPNRWLKVYRASMRAVLGVALDTISHYAKHLRDIELWGGMLLVTKPCTLFANILNPKCKATLRQYGWTMERDTYYHFRNEDTVEYQATVYLRHAFYDVVMQRQQFPVTAKIPHHAQGKCPSPPPPSEPQKLKASEARKQILTNARMLHDLLVHDESAYFGDPNYPNLNLATLHAALPPTLESDTPFEENAPANSRRCRGCECRFYSQTEEVLCPKCEAKRQEIIKNRLKMQHKPATLQEDCCEFCHSFFVSDVFPLSGVCRECEPWEFKDKPPVQQLYCPRHQCGEKIYLTHYTSMTPPSECPGCQKRIPASLWRKSKPLPPEKLPFAPINYYRTDFVTLFDIMEIYHHYEDFTSLQFGRDFTPEQMKAWHSYRARFYTQVTCQICGKKRHVKKHEAKTFKTCSTCSWGVDASKLPIPEAANLVMTSHHAAELDRLQSLACELFGSPPKKETDIPFAVNEYGLEWVEHALRATYRRKMGRQKGEKRIYNYFPYTLGTLKNWRNQGYINHSDFEVGEQEIQADYARHRTHPWNFIQLATLGTHNVYQAFHNFIRPLNTQTAQYISFAVSKYGEGAVRHAMLETIRQERLHWGYCRAILENWEKEDRLKEFN